MSNITKIVDKTIDIVYPCLGGIQAEETLGRWSYRGPHPVSIPTPTTGLRTQGQRGRNPGKMARKSS